MFFSNFFQSLFSHVLLFLLLLSCKYKYSSAKIIVAITQPHGQRILSFAEINLYRDKLRLPDYLISYSFSQPTSSCHEARYCNDDDVFTYCQSAVVFNESSSQWEGVETSPTLFIHLANAYFDEMVCYSHICIDTKLLSMHEYTHTTT